MRLSGNAIASLVLFALLLLAPLAREAVYPVFLMKLMRDAEVTGTRPVGAGGRHAGHDSKMPAPLAVFRYSASGGRAKLRR